MSPAYNKLLTRFLDNQNDRDYNLLCDSPDLLDFMYEDYWAAREMYWNASKKLTNETLRRVMG